MAEGWIDGRGRLGFIYPFGGGDQEFYEFLEAQFGDEVKVLMVSSRLWGDDKDHQLDALLKSGDVEHLRAVAGKFSRLAPDSVMWACTSGSFVGGLAWAEAQADAIRAASGVAASGTSLAFLAGLRHLRLKRVAVLATYPQAIAERFSHFLADAEVTVCHIEALDILSGWDAAHLAEDELTAAILGADRKEAEAILVPDTAVPTLHLIDRLEARLGKPILTANQVTIWHALRLANADFSTSAGGTLLKDGNAKGSMRAAL